MVFFLIITKLSWIRTFANASYTGRQISAMWSLKAFITKLFFTRQKYIILAFALLILLAVIALIVGLSVGLTKPPVWELLWLMHEVTFYTKLPFFTHIIHLLIRLYVLDFIQPFTHRMVSKGYTNFFFLLFASLSSSRQDDRSHSLDSVCSNKEETGRARPLLISLAQTLVVNGKC